MKRGFVVYAVMLAYLSVALRPSPAYSQPIPVTEAAPPQQVAPAVAEPVAAEPQQVAPAVAVPVAAEPQQVAPAPPPASQPTGRPRIAVYVSEHGGYNREEKEALRTAALGELVRSNRYQVIERSDIIEAELAKQTSGAVDDDQLTAFGKQSGAQFICVVDMTHLRNWSQRITRTETYQCGDKYCTREVYIRTDNYRDYQFSARMIDVETAEILAFGLLEVSILSGGGAGAQTTKSIEAAVQKMFGNVQAAKPASMPKMAVYVAGGGSRDNAGNALYSYSLEALFMRSRKLGTFKVIERSDAFTRQIEREQGKQLSGHVADNQIMRLGKQYGIGQILVASILPSGDQYQLSARIINVETANIDKASQTEHTGKDLKGLGQRATHFVEEMMGITADEQREREIARQKAAAAKAEADAIAAKKARNTIIWGVIGIAALIGVLIWANASAEKEDQKTTDKW